MVNVYNTSKLSFHPEKLKALSQGEIIAPLYVRVKPTNKCNHGCFYCSYAPGSTAPVSETINLIDEIPKEKMLEILSDFRDMGVKAITYSGGGEPLIYPHIEEVMRKTLEYGIDLSIITNGQSLKGEKAEILANAKWVRISSAEIDAETFAEVRKRPESWFYDLIENIRNFAKIKNHDCELGINFAVYKKNADKVYTAIKYFKGLGVNHIKITPCWFPNFLEYHKDTRDSVIKQIAKAREEFEDGSFQIYDTYENDFKLTGINERTYHKCFVMQTIPVIGADSKVYFCHDKTYSKNGALGSIKERSFKDLWFSEEAAKIFRNFDSKEGCKHHCTYDSRNLFIADILCNLDNLKNHMPENDRHKNFV